MQPHELRLQTFSASKSNDVVQSPNANATDANANGPPAVLKESVVMIKVWLFLIHYKTLTRPLNVANTVTCPFVTGCRIVRQQLTLSDVPEYLRCRAPSIPNTNTQF